MNWNYIIIVVLIVFIGITFYNIRKAELKVKDIILVGLFAALTAVGAFIKIPTPFVPVTLHVFFCIFAGALLGARLGMLSQMIYILVGLTGVPIFTNGGGPAYIFQPTFGYMLGFVVGAYTVGKVISCFNNKSLYVYIIASIAGTFVIYIIGVPYLYVINSIYLSKEFTVQMAVTYGFLTTIVKDIVMSVIASMLVVQLRKVLLKSNLINQYR